MNEYTKEQIDFDFNNKIHELNETIVSIKHVIRKMPFLLSFIAIIIMVLFFIMQPLIMNVCLKQLLIFYIVIKFVIALDCCVGIFLSQPLIMPLERLLRLQKDEACRIMEGKILANKKIIHAIRETIKSLTGCCCSMVVCYCFCFCAINNTYKDEMFIILIVWMFFNIGVACLFLLVRDVD